MPARPLQCRLHQRASSQYWRLSFYAWQAYTVGRVNIDRIV